ncbi:early nodulin-like protein 6 [Wolffia australiana]
MGSWWRMAVAVVVVVIGALGRSAAFSFDVGGDGGWQVPPSNNSAMYNRWASKNRFKIGDTLVFKYKKDSVMMVGEEDYGRCKAELPILFDDNGDTEIALDRAGLYYFISGLHEHCKKGQKMIIKVLNLPEPPAASPAAPSSPPGRSPPPMVARSGAAAAFRRCNGAGLLFMLAAASLFFL